MSKKKTPREQYAAAIAGLGYGESIGDTIPARITYGEAVRELRYYVGMAKEDGEPLNVEIFGDGYEKPNPNTRRAYFAARRLVRKWSIMSPGLVMP